MPADRIGDRYRVARRLGTGGMARVYLCWDERLELWCAIKVMGARTVADPVLRARFGQEAKTLARLVHPHVVRVFDLVHDVETPYMVMEYLEGGTVWRRVKRAGALHPWQAAKVIAEVCDGLQAAHDAGVVHRDVKPQNVLLDADGTVKVSDFGVARVEQAFRLTLSNMALGTLAYMSPEQQRDAARVDVRADVYSAGATLFALATGRRPTALLSSERHAAIQTMVPTLVRDIVTRATRADPGERYATAGEMAEALRQVCAAEHEPPALPPLVDRPTPPPAEPPSDPSGEISAEELTGTRQPYGPDAELTHPQNDMVTGLDDDDPTIRMSREQAEGFAWAEMPDQLPPLRDADTGPALEPPPRPAPSQPSGVATAQLPSRAQISGPPVPDGPPPRRGRFFVLALVFVVVLVCAGCGGTGVLATAGAMLGVVYG